MTDPGHGAPVAADVVQAPLLEPDALEEVRAALVAARYTADEVLNRIGEAGQAGLGRNTTVAAETAVDVYADAAGTDALATCIRLWVLQRGVDRDEAADALPLDALIAAGVLSERDSGVAAEVDIRPYGSQHDGASGWIVADLTPGLNHAPVDPRTDYVLGVSPASTTLAQMTARTPVERALDLGTGCGVQSLHLARHAARVVATDLNPRAVAMAATTAALNQVDLDLRLGSLYQPVAGERFDLIVTNPPYVMSPPSSDASRLTYREGALSGDDLVRQVVTEGIAHLNPGGMLQVLGNWAVLRNQPWQDRIASWVADTGADLWVLERERLDPFEYIEMWLTDAGLAGTDQWRPRFEQWLAYFDQLGIEAVGMGWIAVTKAERTQPDVWIEQWPWAVEQPVGPAFAARRWCVDAATAADEDLLATRWRLNPDVVQETLGAPGEEDPQHIVLRSSTGLRRALEVNTELGGVLGACDGELSLEAIITAVATLVERPADQVIAETLPGVRQALRDDLLAGDFGQGHAKT